MSTRSSSLTEQNSVWPNLNWLTLLALKLQRDHTSRPVVYLRETAIPSGSGKGATRGQPKFWGSWTWPTCPPFVERASTVGGGWWYMVVESTSSCDNMIESAVWFLSYFRMSCFARRALNVTAGLVGWSAGRVARWRCSLGLIWFDRNCACMQSDDSRTSSTYIWWLVGSYRRASSSYTHVGSLAFTHTHTHAHTLH